MVKNSVGKKMVDEKKHVGNHRGFKIYKVVERNWDDDIEDVVEETSYRAKKKDRNKTFLFSCLILSSTGFVTSAFYLAVNDEYNIAAFVVFIISFFVLIWVTSGSPTFIAKSETGIKRKIDYYSKQE